MHRYEFILIFPIPLCGGSALNLPVAMFTQNAKAPIIMDVFISQRDTRNTWMRPAS